MPYVVQLKINFGTTGVKIPRVLRGLQHRVVLDSSHGVGAGLSTKAASRFCGDSITSVVFGLFTLLQVGLAIERIPRNQVA